MTLSMVTELHASDIDSRGSLSHLERQRRPVKSPLLRMAQRRDSFLITPPEVGHPWVVAPFLFPSPNPFTYYRDPPQCIPLNGLGRSTKTPS